MMIRCAQTVSGVLMIIGLAFLAGLVQSMLIARPVILGAVATPPSGVTTPAPPTGGPAPAGQDRPQADDTAPESPPDAATSDPRAAGDEAGDDGGDDGGEAEYEARLDAPVPAGMLTLRQAHQMWIDGAYFVDARRLDEYEAGHVSGAAHLTAENIVTSAGQDQLATIPPDAAVVIYCIGGEGCDASKNTMALMQQYGYTDMHIMGVGYDEWAAAGLPTEEGAP